MADPREGAGVFTSLSPLPTEGGTLFRVVSNAEALHLLLYGKEREKPTVIALDETHRRDDVWEILVPGVGSGQRYNWAVDPARPLVDPYALEVDGPDTFGADTKGPRPVWPDLNVAHRFAGVVRAPLPRVEWRRPARSWDETVLYELHVRGFTRHASSRVKEPGGFRGLIEKVGYLQRLGVTAVELLPVQEFDDQEVHRGRGLVNYWGYSPLNWFAPNARYGSIEDFRGLVRAFHDAGIEVIVDVVFNHTAEMDPTGPVWNFRDLDNDRYYLEEDVTGCGNTVKAQHPTVRKLILEALRWWRHGLGVDGFRFDLAAVLARGETGEVLDAPALLREIETDPWLSGARLIAEAWDAGGAYLVTDWPGNERWAVWNDRFRDDVRRAWLNGGDNGIGHRLAGSPDLFPDPRRSINFITAHDGFTLMDVVSYDERHNEANGEQGRDGHAHSVSHNHGVEGPTCDEAIRAQRDRARRSLVASLLLARGIPMLCAGDELGRTQDGNNNAYCHDGPLTWLDWTGEQRDAAFLRFVRALIRLRKERVLLDDELEWFGPGDGLFGYRTKRLAVVCNVRDEPATIELPDESWQLVVDTAAAPPLDIPAKPAAVGAVIEVAPRSLVAFAP